jgi:tryptophan-rich sensory protein
MIDVRRTTLRVDAVFLTLAGVFGLVGDILSYRSGIGPFGTTFYQNPTVIGVVEAHSLAVLTAVTLWYCSQQRTGTFGHWVGLSAHLVLGGSNIIWFEVFSRVQAESQGVAVTVVHFLFVALNAFLILRGGENRLASRL